MAQEAKTKKGEFSIVSLKHLSQVSGISYSRLYSVFVLKKYDSFTENELTTISNALFSEVQKSFKTLGFKINITRIKR